MTETTPPPNDLWGERSGHSRSKLEVGEDGAWFCKHEQLRVALPELERSAVVALALRAAKRVDPVVSYRRIFAECYSARVARPRLHRSGRTTYTTEAAANAATYAASAADAAADSADTSTANDAYSYAADAVADADAAAYAAAHAHAAAAFAYADAVAYADADLWELVSLDFARLKKLQHAQPPLTGWDDPRLGPLWPDGAPEWHQQLEREVAEMRAKLDARPDPFAPPIPDETRRKLDDHRKLNELGDQGAFKDCRGQYVFVYNGEFVGHGAELGEARRQAAEKLGVPPSSLVYRYVY